MRKIAYFGPRRSGLWTKSTMSKKLDEPTAYDMGIAVPTAASTKVVVTVPWGDVMVCLKEAIGASPEMRADLKTMLDEQALGEARTYTAADGKEPA